ncbi:hypothetical protein ATN00_18910 [Sphingobium baderi]|uniref:Uncharacterized protein n=1 Tax=Sphingobium baderi TaxID=1332080 RepID=A0A0S3F322_9SPHN|nr:hypothetical protein ATN00_18910 [Sphingobium baderi]
MTGCAAWRDLSGNAIKVLVALLRFDKGGDNGELFMSVRIAAEETGLSENTAWKALRELEDHGFIAATERGHFKRKHRPATQWRVTWQAANGKAPTRDFEKWEPSGNKTRSQNLRSTVAKIETGEETFPATVAKIGTASTETSHFSAPAPVSNIATQVVSHGQGANHAHAGTGNMDGPSQHVPPPKGGDGQSATVIRDKLKSLLRTCPAGTQSRLAEAAKIPGGTLSKFINEGKALSVPQSVRLHLKLAELEKSAGASRAA